MRPLTEKQQEVLVLVAHDAAWSGARDKNGRGVQGRRRTLYSLKRAGLVEWNFGTGEVRLTTAGRDALGSTDTERR